MTQIARIQMKVEIIRVMAGQVIMTTPGQITIDQVTTTGEIIMEGTTSQIIKTMDNTTEGLMVIIKIEIIQVGIISIIVTRMATEIQEDLITAIICVANIIAGEMQQIHSSVNLDASTTRLKFVLHI